MRDNTINVNYFNKVDSYNKAYLLGFIAADGAIVNNRGHSTCTLTITIQKRDCSVLELLKSELNSELSIKTINIKSKSLNSYKLDVDHRRFNTSRKEIIKDLESYGIGQNKSLTMGSIIPNIPPEFRKAFIIGYFDGDGCFVDSQLMRTRKYTKKDGTISTYSGLRWNSSISIKGTKEFLLDIVKELSITTYSLKQLSDQKIHTLIIGSNEGILKLYDCYTYCDFYLSRKKDKFTRKVLQVQTISSSI